jgi:hypothetical protein
MKLGSRKVRYLGIIARIKRRPKARKRHHNKLLDLTRIAFEAEGREFESLRARHSDPHSVLAVQRNAAFVLISLKSSRNISTKAIITDITTGPIKRPTNPNSWIPPNRANNRSRG